MSGNGDLLVFGTFPKVMHLDILTDQDTTAAKISTGLQDQTIPAIGQVQRLPE